MQLLLYYLVLKIEEEENKEQKEGTFNNELKSQISMGIER